MDKIKDFINKEYESEYIEYIIDDFEYLINPMFIIAKHNDKYLISFDIDADKSHCLQIYHEIQEFFITDNIFFLPYYDCVIMMGKKNNLEYFAFGEEAKRYYYTEIYSNMNELSKVPENATIH